LIVDFHTHIFPRWLRDERDRYLGIDATFGELYANPRARMATADNLIRAMDEDGVDKSVVMGLGWTDYGLAREVNDYIIESMRQHPERIIGFAGVNPAWGDNAVKEADRCASAGLKGVGELHPDTQGFDPGDRKVMAPLMEVARSHSLIVNIHSSEPVGHLYQGKGKTTPGVLWRFIQNFPDVTIVCAHWGGGLPFYALMPEVGESLANVYFDTAASPFLYTPDIFRVAAGLVGVDRILLASDYSLLRMKRLLAHLDESGLSEPEKEMVRGGNAVRLLQAIG
jgi:hypothetical protein